MISFKTRQLRQCSGLEHLDLQASGGTSYLKLVGDFADFPRKRFMELDGHKCNVDGIVLTSDSVNHAFMLYSIIINAGASQAWIDSYLEYLYNNRFTIPLTQVSYVTVNITGNAEPSGTYQDANPPTTGREFWYKLHENPESEDRPPYNITQTV